MRQIETPNGYLVIEKNNILDVYMHDCFVCELSGTFSNFTYNGVVDTNKLDDAIAEEMNISELIYNV